VAGDLCHTLGYALKGCSCYSYALEVARGVAETGTREGHATAVLFVIVGLAHMASVSDSISISAGVTIGISIGVSLTITATNDIISRNMNSSSCHLLASPNGREEESGGSRMWCISRPGVAMTTSGLFALWKC